MESQLDRLDRVALEVAGGNMSGFGPLSTGERLYVAMASNRPELLQDDGYTVVEALARIGPEWVAQLVQRWQYRGNPKSG